jgi:hypothetical protein
MVVHLSQYRHIVPITKTFMELHGHRDRDYILNLVACYTHCPLIVIVYFMAELTSRDSWFDENVNRLMKFYKYDKITE